MNVMVCGTDKKEKENCNERIIPNKKACVIQAEMAIFSLETNQNQINNYKALPIS